MMRTIYNYYLVFKTCWMSILFLMVGYFALCLFAQGQDILKELSLKNEDLVLVRHAWLMWVAVCWWGWQSFRTSRIQLHLSYFNFWNWSPEYALGSQVQVPRLLATIPFFIVSWAIYQAKGQFDPQIALYMSSALWMYVFLHFRRNIIVWLRSKRGSLHKFVPDYIPIKNGSYPVKFVIKKQGFWLFFRLVLLLFTFFIVMAFPIKVSVFMGSAAIILWAFGAWLVVIGIASILGKRTRIPVTLTIVVWAVIFSFFNNNHKVRTLNKIVDRRPNLERYFLKWLQGAKKDKDSESKTVYLFAAEGGGIRSAYWSSAILTQIQDIDPEFKQNIFCLSGVSGGSLGSAITAGLLYQSVRTTDYRKRSGEILKSDFLSPVTSWLMFPDILQKFIPFPVNQFDRARALEYSWEKSWDNSEVNAPYMTEGFLKTFDLNTSRLPVIILNATLAEKGSRALITNIDPEEVFFDEVDLMRIIGKDIPVSTAVGLSARFPLLTPPATIFNKDNKLYGSVVDGGYYENSGATTILEVYFKLREIAEANHLNVNFQVVMLKNTMKHERRDPIKGLSELLAPLTAFGNVWYKSGSFGVISAEKFILKRNDKMYTISLNRSENQNLPLGWYLSGAARKLIDEQVLDAANQLIYKSNE